MATAGCSESPAEAAEPPQRRLLALDLLIVLLVVGTVVANSAHAPSNTYTYAQKLQCGAALGMMESGNYWLPRNQVGNIARKGQLLTWCQVAVLKLTGVYSDFTYRFPTVVASFVTATLVYLLGRRWYGRRAGLLAACLWAVCHHMGKEMYVGLTDMMLTMWITASVFCADRLLFHKAPRAQRRWWGVGLWGTMILGALTKGWGAGSLPLVVFFFAFATAVRPGFGALRVMGGFRSKLALAFRLIWRRWRRAMKATYFLPGVAVLLVVLAAVWGSLFYVGGSEFAEIVYFQIVQRATGVGEQPPHPSSVPAIAKLLYYAMPASVFAVGTLLLVAAAPWPNRGRWYQRTGQWLRATGSRWFGRGPIFLPLCWAIAIVLPFSFTHGSRPDYLLPAFAAVALMAAWGVEEVLRRGRGWHWATDLCRHVFAAAPVVIGAMLIVAPLLYLFHDRMPGFVQKSVKLPATATAATWFILACLVPLGLGVLTWAVRSSLRWRLRSLAAVTVVGMLGVMFLDRHFIAFQARTGDGDKMVAFARAAEPALAYEPFATYRMTDSCIEPYLGRFGAIPQGAAPNEPRNVIWSREKLKQSDIRWLFISDYGLTEWSQAQSQIQGRQVRIAAADLGTVVVTGGPIEESDRGRLYLVKLAEAPEATAGREGQDE